MSYRVIIWDQPNHQTKYYDVDDAIDYDDAEQTVKEQYPDVDILATVYRNDDAIANENQ